MYNVCITLRKLRTCNLSGKKWRVDGGQKKPAFLRNVFSFAESCSGGHTTSSLTRGPSALTLLANDSRRACASPAVATIAAGGAHATAVRCGCMHSLQVGCPAGRHGKPIIHLNTKPERCMWLKLMLFLPLLKLSVSPSLGLFPAPSPPPASPGVLHASTERFEQIFSVARSS